VPTPIVPLWLPFLSIEIRGKGNTREEDKEKREEDES
jgi:hypothetical protein